MIPTRRTGRFYGWRVVGGAFVLATFGWGMGFYGPPIFLHAVSSTRGWPLALVSAAVTVHFLIGAVVVANLPALYRRFGLPAVTRAGALALAVGILGWATAASPWQLFAATIFSGAGWVALSAAAVNAIVSPWFVRARPAALAMAYNGASIGGVVFSPLWVAAIGLVGFPACRRGDRARRDPHHLGSGRAAVFADAAADGTDARWRRCGHARRLARLARRDAAAARGAVARPPVPDAVGRHGARAVRADRPDRASVLAAGAGARRNGPASRWAPRPPRRSRAARWSAGWMPAGADRRLVACASYAVQIVGSLAFIAAAGTNVPLLLLGVLLFGIGIGNATSLPPLIAQVEFVADDVPRVVSLIVAIAQAAYAFAPAVFGLIREFAPAASGASAGAALPFYAAAALVQALAIAVFLAGRRR